LKAAILAYHSQNIAGNDTYNNDHVALAADLDALHAAGCRFVSLATLINAVFADAPPASEAPLICLTFDDGCDFDVRTLEFPGHGLQPGLLQIMEDFVTRQGGAAQPGLHATSFVIASPEARRLIDSKSLFGSSHMSDDWWRKADAHPMMAIGNHGWDHNHPDLEEEHYPRGGFEQVSSLEDCHQQVVGAAEFIGQKTGRRPRFFAYPFGESSDYIRDEYFPLRGDEHGCLAALGTDPGLVSTQSNRWNLPRFVCGRDWPTPSELLATLDLSPAR
jgi:peptidoglycan/xylan/chitin deacetylase (PgdA/CDA1 family)